MVPHAWAFLPDFCATICILIKTPERAFFYCDYLNNLDLFYAFKTLIISVGSILFKILGEFYINYWDDNAAGKYIPFLYLINFKNLRGI